MCELPFLKAVPESQNEDNLLAANRAWPTAGQTTVCLYVQAELARWRELNLAADFQQACQKLVPFSRSAPLLVLHQVSVAVTTVTVVTA